MMEPILKGYFILGGQQVFYDDEGTTLYVSIKEPFMKAGHLLSWDEEKCAGFGFNKEIINFVKTRKCYFVVKVISEGKFYWMDYDKLVDFMEKNNTAYILANGTTVTVISWKKFIHVTEHNEI